MPRLTQDEESSGIIDVTALFDGVAGYDTDTYQYFLLDVRAHALTDPALVEGRQLLLMAVQAVTGTGQPVADGGVMLGFTLYGAPPPR